MEKIYYIFIFCILATCHISCSEEDTLEPSGIYENSFMISPDANDPESVLRREFYERNGVHLLFNDTLRHEQVATNADGTPYWFTETVDIAYGISSYSDDPFNFGFIKDQTTRQASINFVETYILPHLGNGLRPYSIFLTTEISYIDYFDDLIYLDYYNGMRCFVINVKDALQMEDAGKKAFSTNIFRNIVSKKINQLDKSLLAEFYSFCDSYYGKQYSNFGIPNNPAFEVVYALGFLDKRSSYFVYKDTDQTNYIDAIFNNDEQEFKQQYADYPIILQKYDLLKKVISNMGFIF